MKEVFHRLRVWVSELFSRPDGCEVVLGNGGKGGDRRDHWDHRAIGLLAMDPLGHRTLGCGGGSGRGCGPGGRRGGSQGDRRGFLVAAMSGVPLLWANRGTVVPAGVSGEAGRAAEHPLPRHQAPEKRRTLSCSTLT